MFGLGFTELAVILVIILVLFGAGKLPKILGQLGKGVSEFKDGMKEGAQKPSQKSTSSKKTKK